MAAAPLISLLLAAAALASCSGTRDLECGHLQSSKVECFRSGLNNWRCSFQDQEHDGESGDGDRLEGTQHGSNDVQEGTLGGMLLRSECRRLSSRGADGTPPQDGLRRPKAAGTVSKRSVALS